jgi:anti-anti-sigma factor
MAFVPAEPVQFARTKDGIVIVRVHGKGTHMQSAALRDVFDRTRELEPPVRYVIDLEHCTTLDSTFMGTLAAMANHQMKATGAQLVIVNIQKHVRYLLQTLGLNFILDMRQDPATGTGAVQPGAFKPANAPNMTSLERMVMMIEAHEALVEADSENEIKFEGVLRDLRESLERAKRKNPE